MACKECVYNTTLRSLRIAKKKKKDSFLHCLSTTVEGKTPHTSFPNFPNLIHSAKLNSNAAPVKLF